MTTSLPLSNPVVRNSLATLAIRGAFGIARLLMLFLIARAFGSDIFGQLALVLSFVEIAKVVADFGLDVVSIRRFASPGAQTEAIMNTLLATKVVLATSAAIVLPGVMVLLYGSDAGVNILWVLLPSILTGLLINTFTSYFHSRLSVARTVIANAAGVGVFVGLTIVALGLQTPVTVVAAAIPISELVTLGLLYRLYTRKHVVRPQYDRALLVSLFQDSAFVGVSGIIVVLYLRLDGLLIAHYLGSTALGQYALAYRIIEPFFLVFSSLSISLYASLSETWGSKNVASAPRLIRKTILTTSCMAVAGILLVEFGARPLIAIVAHEYEEASRALTVLSLLIVFRALNPQLSAILNSLGKYRALMVVTMVNLVTCIVFSVLLIPRHGIVGAAAAVVITEFVNSCIQGLLVRTHMRNLQQAS